MKKIVLFQMLVIVALLSLFVTACDTAPKSEGAYIESTDLPKSSGVDIFAGKTFTGKDLMQSPRVKYEFDNEGSVIYSEISDYSDTDNYVKIAKYNYAYTPKEEKKGIHTLRIHFKPIGYYIDDVLYADSDEYVNKLIADIKNDSVSVSDEYTEIMKKIYKYQFTSTKDSRNYNYYEDNETENLTFTSDIYVRNISNIMYTDGTNISSQLAGRSFETRLGVNSQKCALIFTDGSNNNLLKELDFQIYECTKNKAKVVCTYLDETTSGEDNSEIHKEYKVAGYAKVTVDYKVEMGIIPKSNTSSKELYARVKITGVDDNLMEYLTNELADITGTGEGFVVDSILNKEFQISTPYGSNSCYCYGMLK